MGHLQVRLVKVAVVTNFPPASLRAGRSIPGRCGYCGGHCGGTGAFGVRIDPYAIVVELLLLAARPLSAEIN
jgi:hypothetical protein